jgi:hypothetical protein
MLLPWRYSPDGHNGGAPYYILGDLHGWLRAGYLRSILEVAAPPPSVSGLSGLRKPFSSGYVNILGTLGSMLEQ